MSNEGVVNLALSFSKRGASFQSTPDSEALRTHRFDVTGNYAIQQIFSVGTTDTVLDLENVGVPGYVFFHNLSLSNQVLFGGDGSSYPGKLRPDGYAILEFGSADIHMIASTNCNVEALILPGTPPPTPTGACCIAGVCSILTEAACILAGGTYQGDGTPCSPNPCTEPDVGDIETVWLANDLSFQVLRTLDSPDYEFYPQDIHPPDAGTFIWDGSVLYAPDFFAHDTTSAGFEIGDFTPFTEISQNTTGSGTSGDPYVTITIVTAGTLTITQTDTWFAGSEFFTTDIAITGVGSGILYRAGDTFLARSDNSYGFSEAAGSGTAVGVSTNANNTPPAQTIEFIPVTGSNNYMEGLSSDVWGVIAARTAFPDTIQGSTALDAGCGISWPFTAPATFSMKTKFAAP
jgi:hypothetical protein